MDVSRAFAAVVVVLTGLFATASALAGGPREEVREATNRLMAIVKSPDYKDPAKADEVAKRIRAVTEAHFSGEAMAKRILGRHWRKRTDEERTEFVALIKDLTERTYLSELEAHTDQGLVYPGEVVDGRFARVKLVILTRRGVGIKVTYRLFKRKKGAARPTTTRPTSRPAPQWLAYDVVIEGVSLVNNYRTQVRDILARSSYEDLLKRLRAKIAGQRKGDGRDDD